MIHSDGLPGLPDQLVLPVVVVVAAHPAVLALDAGGGDHLHEGAVIHDPDLEEAVDVVGSSPLDHLEDFFCSLFVDSLLVVDQVPAGPIDRQ